MTICYTKLAAEEAREEQRPRPAWWYRLWTWVR